MNPDLEQVYGVIFEHWNRENNQVKISMPVLLIIENHFGSDGEDLMINIQDLTLRYWLCRRDMVDHIELSMPDLPLEIIPKEVDKVLKRVLGLDDYTRRYIRDSLSG